MNYTFSDKMATLKPSAIREILKVTSLPGVISFAAGNPALAAEWHYKLLPMFKKLFVVTNPIPVKYCVDRAVMPVGPTRLPMNAPSAEETAIFDGLLQEYGLI